MKLEEIKAACERLDAYEAEKLDILNTGRTFSEMEYNIYRSRRDYLDLVYHDNGHRNVLALIKLIEEGKKHT